MADELMPKGDKPSDGVNQERGANVGKGQDQQDDNFVVNIRNQEKVLTTRISTYMAIVVGAIGVGSLAKTNFHNSWAEVFFYLAVTLLFCLVPLGLTWYVRLRPKARAAETVVAKVGESRFFIYGIYLIGFYVIGDSIRAWPWSPRATLVNIVMGIFLVFAATIYLALRVVLGWIVQLSEVTGRRIERAIDIGKKGTI